MILYDGPSLLTGDPIVDDYVLLGTKTEQIERIGNSVCPDVARAIVEANTWFN